jgi:hypothetical protein
MSQLHKHTWRQEKQLEMLLSAHCVRLLLLRLLQTCPWHQPCIGTACQTAALAVTSSCRCSPVRVMPHLHFQSCSQPPAAHKTHRMHHPSILQT